MPKFSRNEINIAKIMLTINKKPKKKLLVTHRVDLD